MAEAYRAEVIGSLLRPADLKDARRRHASGVIIDARQRVKGDRVYSWPGGQGR
jgi:methionine synthase II (cobalamin-independent)